MNVNQVIANLRLHLATVERAIEALEELKALMAEGETGHFVRGRRGRISMGAAERREVSRRMKNYWARRHQQVKAAL